MLESRCFGQKFKPNYKFFAIFWTFGKLKIAGLKKSVGLLYQRLQSILMFQDSLIERLVPTLPVARHLAADEGHEADGAREALLGGVPVRAVQRDALVLGVYQFSAGIALLQECGHTVELQLPSHQTNTQNTR